MLPAAGAAVRASPMGRHAIRLGEASRASLTAGSPEPISPGKNGRRFRETVDGGGKRKSLFHQYSSSSARKRPISRAKAINHKPLRSTFHDARAFVRAASVMQAPTPRIVICYLSLFTRKLRKDTDGAIAIEFAFVGPVLLYLMINIFVGAIYLGASHKLQHIAAQAARASIAGTTEDERLTIVRRSLDQSLEDGTLLPASAINVTVASLSADRKHYRVSLSFDTQALGLRRFPGISTVMPATLTGSYDVRSGGL